MTLLSCSSRPCRTSHARPPPSHGRTIPDHLGRHVQGSVKESWSVLGIKPATPRGKHQHNQARHAREYPDLKSLVPLSTISSPWCNTTMSTLTVQREHCSDERRGSPDSLLLANGIAKLTSGAELLFHWSGPVYIQDTREVWQAGGTSIPFGLPFPPSANASSGGLAGELGSVCCTPPIRISQRVPGTVDITGPLSLRRSGGGFDQTWLKMTGSIPSVT